MSITSYTLKIKDLCDSLNSICVNVEDGLSGLTPWFNTMTTIVLDGGKPPSFFDLQSMLLVEENQQFEQGAMPRKATCSIHIRMKEEDVVEQEAEQGRGGRGPTYENNSQFQQ